jgi:hypothetical protein
VVETLGGVANQCIVDRHRPGAAWYLSTHRSQRRCYPSTGILDRGHQAPAFWRNKTVASVEESGARNSA